MKTFYAINLNGKYQGTSRWALYEMKKGGLEVIWPKHLEADKGPVLWPHQVFSRIKQYPTYHFRVTGYGLSHIDKLANELALHFQETIHIKPMRGYGLSTTVGIYKECK